MRHMRKTIIALTVLTACGGGSGWSDSQAQEFIDGCTSTGQSDALCTCIQEKLEAAHPDLKDPADLDQAEVVDFTKECAG